MILLREYNLFIIKKEYFDYYQRNPLFLFDVLKNLYHLKHDFNYGISLYDQLCERINIFHWKYYLNKRYSLDNERTFYIDRTFIELRHSRIIVRSKGNFEIIKDFNEYNKSIFACHFINNDYFWVNKSNSLLVKM